MRARTHTSIIFRFSPSPVSPSLLAVLRAASRLTFPLGFLAVLEIKLQRDARASTSELSLLVCAFHGDDNNDDDGDDDANVRISLTFCSPARSDAKRTQRERTSSSSAENKILANVNYRIARAIVDLRGLLPPFRAAPLSLFLSLSLCIPVLKRLYIYLSNSSRV